MRPTVPYSPTTLADAASCHHSLYSRVLADEPVVFRMLTVEFLATFRPPYSSSWEDMFAGLAEDAIEAQTVAVLTDQLREHGMFRDPVCVDPVDLRLCNGCHRVAATVAVGATFIDVTYDTEPDCSDVIGLSLEFTDGVSLDGSDATDDLFDELGSLVRSFPVVDASGLWVEGYGLSSFRGEMTADFPWPQRDVMALVAATRHRIAARKLPVRVTAAHLLDDQFEKDLQLWPATTTA